MTNGLIGILGIRAVSVWGGIVGGFTVCLGVLLAEWFARKREFTFRFDDAFRRTFHEGASIFFAEKDLSSDEIVRRAAAYRVELSMLHSAARRPLRNAKAIEKHMDGVMQRWEIAEKAWIATGEVPSVEKVLGNIGPLIYRPRRWWDL